MLVKQGEQLLKHYGVFDWMSYIVMHLFDVLDLVGSRPFLT
jgi:hypothetical protein